MEKLFNEWYKQQCINENAKESSFICDGSLSDDYLEQHEILFVCRESHDTALGFKKYFWFKNVVDGLATKGKKYYNCVKSIIDYINNNIEPENENIDIKKNFFHTRLNFILLGGIVILSIIMRVKAMIMLIYLL